MNLKKKLLMILVSLAMLSVVLYSGEQSALAQANQEHGIISAKDTLYLWYTDSELTDYLNSAALAYYEDTDVRIVPVLKSALEYVEEINRASLYDEEIPDVFIIGNESLEKVYLSGLASPVTDPDGVLTTDNYPDTALHAVTYKDQYVGYPYYFQSSIFVYNRTYLEDSAKELVSQELGLSEVDSGQQAEYTDETGDETVDASTPTSVTEEEMAALVEEKLDSMLPKTIDDILTMANSYDAPENVEAVFKWDVSDIFYNYFVTGNYLLLGGEDGDDSEQVDIYNEDAIRCLQIYQDLNAFFSLSTDENSYDDVIQDFIDGKIVMTVATTDIIQKIETAKEEGNFPYDYEVTTIPDVSTEYQSRGLSVTSTLVVNGYCDNKEAANDFATYLAYDQSQNLYQRTGKIASKSSIDYEDDQINACLDEYAKSISIPKLMETSNFWVALEIAFDKIWSGEDVNEQLKTLSEQIKKQLNWENYTEEYIEITEEDTTETVAGD